MRILLPVGSKLQGTPLFILKEASPVGIKNLLLTCFACSCNALLAAHMLELTGELLELHRADQLEQAPPGGQGIQRRQALRNHLRRQDAPA